MTFRKILFWLHLCAGVTAGIVVLIMSVTGVLLTYEKQMLVWANRSFYEEPPSPGAQRASIETVLDRIREEKGTLPVSVTLRSDPAAPLEANLGSSGTILVNRYTGQILGEAASGMREFFHVVTDWHRWLGAHGESRALGRGITGASNLLFLFIVLSGIYLWWPRQWKWQSVKAVTLFRSGLGGKARDFNWHNVFGFWSAIPLAIIVASAVVISYPWASNLVYQAVGETPPVRRGAPPTKPSVTAKQGDQRGKPAERPGETKPGKTPSPAARASGGGPRGRSSPPPLNLNLEGFDQLLKTAENREDDWRTISFRLPQSEDQPVTFSIDRGYGGQPHLRSQLTLDRMSAETVAWQTFGDQSRGRKLRSVLRFAHTGEVGGLAGQTIAGLVSLATCFLVWTGIALTWRRYWAWRKRRKGKTPPTTPLEADGTPSDQGVATLTAP